MPPQPIWRYPTLIQKGVHSMAELARLTFSNLVSLAKASTSANAACACSCPVLRSWESVPLALADADFEDVGTLLDDPYIEPTFVEFHPDGTRYDSPDAPIAPRYFPYNRCNVSKCLRCGRMFLRYVEAGGYFVDRRIRALSPDLLVDAPLAED
jgi:hypothetical protein